ncbi:MAG TPA: hypothetical protein GX000_07705 [Actinomyces sp.]|jgi:hypothetical protein|nr:hypothetical protein [Acidobacteriota bacterium]HHT41500.1 hypothetical protein [Actinomyces sp.]
MKRTRVALVALALALTGTGLAGCADEVPEVPEPVEGPSEVESPNLDSEQVQTVLEDVMAVVKEADEAKDPKLLEPRVKAPASTLRAGFYKLAAARGTDMSGINLDTKSATVTKTDEWPRAIVVPTQAAEGELPALVFITQDSARDDYKMQNWVRMFPGQTVQTAAVSEGTPVVPNDSEAFLLSPTQAMTAWAQRLDGGEENADLLAEDDFTTYYQNERKKLSDALGESGTVTFKATAAESPLTAVELVDGSALVAGHITYTVTYERSDERANITIGGSAGELMDDPTVHEEPVQVTYLTTVVLSIPEKGSDAKIQAVGAERVIQSVKRLEE